MGKNSCYKTHICCQEKEKKFSPMFSISRIIDLGDNISLNSGNVFLANLNPKNPNHLERLSAFTKILIALNKNEQQSTVH
jgi:hypothetical protein